MQMPTFISIKRLSSAPYFQGVLRQDTFDNDIKHDVKTSKSIDWKPDPSLHDSFDQIAFHAMACRMQLHIQENVGWDTESIIRDSICSRELRRIKLSSITHTETDSGSYIVLAVATKNDENTFFGSEKGNVKINVSDMSTYPFAEKLSKEWEALKEEMALFLSREKYEAEPEDMQYNMFDDDVPTEDQDVFA